MCTRGLSPAIRRNRSTVGLADLGDSRFGSPTPKPKPRTPQPYEESTELSKQSKHILIVDDFKDNRDVYGPFLTEGGFRVSFAVDGQDGIEKALQLQPDLILMDLWLPIIGGWEATRRLKADPTTKHIPVVLLTARAFVVASALGCDGCLIKPCLPEDMLAEVHRVLAKSSRPETVPTTLEPQPSPAT